MSRYSSTYYREHPICPFDSESFYVRKRVPGTPRSGPSITGLKRLWKACGTFLDPKPRPTRPGRKGRVHDTSKPTSAPWFEPGRVIPFLSCLAPSSQLGSGRQGIPTVAPTSVSVVDREVSDGCVRSGSTGRSASGSLGRRLQRQCLTTVDREVSTSLTPDPMILECSTRYTSHRYDGRPGPQEGRLP